MELPQNPMLAGRVIFYSTIGTAVCGKRANRYFYFPSPNFFAFAGLFW
jgi:hypothetical protein